MPRHEYICLACGNYYLFVPSSTGVEDKKCPKCSSVNVMKVDMSRIFGFTGGG